MPESTQERREAAEKGWEERRTKAMEPFCADCGADLKPDDEFCPQCEFPVHFHRANERIKAVEERDAEKKAEEQEQADHGRRKMFGVL
jgi:predicted amidophosphoribosyltransferase